jgi:Oxysterol-binding protein
MLAKINAYVAGNKDKNGEIHMPFGMIDSKSIAEFYSDLFSYAPCILKDAIHKGDEFERFKLVLKFAFSILHNLTFQDVFQKKPLMPILGETYEGHYIYQDIANVWMESDYVQFDYVDLLSLRDVVVKKEQATTYI